MGIYEEIIEELKRGIRDQDELEKRELEKREESCSGSDSTSPGCTR